MNCDHITKVIGWGIKRSEGDVIEIPSLYGCTKCDIESDKPLEGYSVIQ